MAAASHGAAWHTSTPMEIIRFAAVNRLCVNLDYQGSSRLIEPYSLRRTRDGNLLLYAVKHNTREDRLYRVDRIQGAEVTKISFMPKYAVELSGAGPTSAPLTTRRTSRVSIARPKRTKSLGKKQKSLTSKYGPKYVFKCIVCGK